MLYITGITGHTGRYFYDRLVKEQYSEEIRVVVREDSDIEFMKDTPLDLEIVIGDLKDISFLDQSMKGADTIFHIADIHYSKNIIEAAINNNVKWAIFVHTTGRYSKYKSASEEYINIDNEVLSHRDKINITILRPTMIYGSIKDRNMIKLITYLDHHKFFPIFGNGRNLLQPVHGRDLGNAYYDILTNREKTRNQEYNLSGEKPITYIELLRTLSTELGRKTIFIKIPFWLCIPLANVYTKIFGKNAMINIEQVYRMKEDKAFSHETANIAFGYTPISFEMGIANETEEYKILKTE